MSRHVWLPWTGVIDVAPHERVRPVRFADAVGATFSQKTCSNVHVRAALQQWYLEGPCVGPCESDRI